MFHLPTVSQRYPLNSQSFIASLYNTFFSSNFDAAIFFHTLFIFLMNDALFVIHSKKHTKYSFKEFIHSKKIQNYPFKEFIHSKKIQNYSFKESIHSKKSKIIHSKKIFIQVKNGLSPRATREG